MGFFGKAVMKIKKIKVKIGTFEEGNCPLHIIVDGCEADEVWLDPKLEDKIDLKVGGADQLHIFVNNNALTVNEVPPDPWEKLQRIDSFMQKYGNALPQQTKLATLKEGEKE